jgi:hypothetical protein
MELKFTVARLLTHTYTDVADKLIELQKFRGEPGEVAHL